MIPLSAYGLSARSTGSPNRSRPRMWRWPGGRAGPGSRSVTPSGCPASRYTRSTESEVGTMGTSTPESTASTRLKPVLDLAREEANLRGDRRIGTDHLLLALLHDEAAPPARALGVTLTDGRDALASLDREALASLGIHLAGPPP